MHSAVIVLPHIFFPDDGPISAETCARLDTAASLWRDRAAPVIVTSGWAGLVSKVTIADAMSDYLEVMGIPKVAIIPCRHGRDTVGDAVYTERLKFGSALVVTSDYHVNRVREVFSFVYGRPVEVKGCMWPTPDGAPERERQSLQTFRRTFDGIEPGDSEAIYARMRERHPFYNGEVFAAV